jgi:hypothetical protein
VGFGVEGAAFEQVEGFSVFDVHGDFVAVLQVGAYTWEMVD